MFSFIGIRKGKQCTVPLHLIGKVPRMLRNYNKFLLSVSGSYWCELYNYVFLVDFTLVVSRVVSHHVIV